MDYEKQVRKEYLLDEISKFVSLKSGIIPVTRFSENSQPISCPKAVSIVKITNICKGSGIDLDPTTAMIKSLAEALERYALRYAKADKNFILYKKSAEELQSMDLTYFYPAYDLHEECVYKNNSNFYRINKKTKINWIPSIRFSDKKRVWIPEGLIYSRRYSSDYLKTLTSNGMSCSFFNSAVEDSILELIERDAFLYMWLGKSPGKEILLDEIHYKPLVKLIDKIDCKRKQINIAYQDTDTRIPYVFIIFKGQKKYNEPAFFITGSANTNIEIACYRALLGFIKLYSNFSTNCLFYKNLINKIRLSESFIIKNFSERTAYYTMYENFHKCAFLFNMKKQEKLSELYKKWNRDRKEKTLKSFLKGKNVFTVDVTPKEIKKTDIRVVRSYSPDLLDLDPSEATPFSFVFKKKRINNINKFFNRKINSFNLNPHCYT